MITKIAIDELVSEVWSQPARYSSEETLRKAMAAAVIEMLDDRETKKIALADAAEQIRFFLSENAYAGADRGVAWHKNAIVALSESARLIENLRPFAPGGTDRARHLSELFDRLTLRVEKLATSLLEIT